MTAGCASCADMAAVNAALIQALVPPFPDGWPALTPRECEIALMLLAARTQDQAIPGPALFGAVFGEGYSVNALRSNITRLRHKLARSGWRITDGTVQGYRLLAPGETDPQLVPVDVARCPRCGGTKGYGAWLCWDCRYPNRLAA